MNKMLPLLAAVAATSLRLGYASLVERRQDDCKNDSASLDELYRARGKQYMGTIADPSLLLDRANADILTATFGQITPESSMKWGAIQPARGRFDFTESDLFVEFAVDNGLLIRGHTLIWYRDLPDWVQGITDYDDLKDTIWTHVTTVVQRYQGKIMAWDVVNEMFADDGSLRDSVFSKVMDEDFVKVAFLAARSVDSQAKLYINDYGLDKAKSAKVTAGMVDHVKRWLSDGVPIDGIGSQAHLEAGKADGVGGALEALANSGVEQVAITELDIVNAPPEDYVTVVNACLEVDACVGTTIWGISDKKDSWQSQKDPLLFDENYEPKRAFTAIARDLCEPKDEEPGDDESTAFRNHKSHGLLPILLLLLTTIV